MRFTYLYRTKMGSEAEKNTVEVEGIEFPAEIAVGKPLTPLAHGITDIEIHFLQIKFNAIGVYVEKSNVLLEHLEKWKGRTAEKLAGDDAFFHDCRLACPLET